MFKTNETSANGLGPKALEKPIQDAEAEMPPSMPAKPHPRNYTWSERMKRVFLVVVEVETAVGDTPEFFGGIRWMDGRENFHRAAAHFAMELLLKLVARPEHCALNSTSAG